MSPSRIVTPRLEAAITEAVRYLDGFVDGSHISPEGFFDGSAKDAEKLRSELLEAFEEARAGQMNAR
jgi:hypothetical protein